MDFQVVTTNLVLQGPVPEHMQKTLYWYAGKQLEASLRASGSNFETKQKHASQNHPNRWFYLVFLRIFTNSANGGSVIRNCLEAVLAALLFLLELCSFKHPRRRGKNTSASQSAFEKYASQAIGKTKPYKKSS